MTITFREILNQKSWNNYEDYIKEGIKEYANELSKDIEEGRRHKKSIREYLEKNFKIEVIPENLQEEGNLLASGNVLGIDGTIATHKTVTGTLAQIGVVAVNYLNEKMQHSYFISEAHYKQNFNEVVEYLYAHESSNKVVSGPVLRAALQVREREIGLDQAYKSKFKLYHGPLIPFEMIANPGRAELKILDVTLEILEALITNKKCFSIVSRSQNDAYIRIGMSLNSGEYIQLKKSLGSEILEDRTILKDKERWRDDDFLRVNSFVQSKARKIKIGVIKIAQRPYVFHAHEEYFDQAAKIIARDAKFQKEKGFPLLIDYADTLCTSYFKASDFNRIIDYQLATVEEFYTETSEESLRLK